MGLENNFKSLLENHQSTINAQPDRNFFTRTIVAVLEANGVSVGQSFSLISRKITETARKAKEKNPELFEKLPFPNKRSYYNQTETRAIFDNIRESMPEKKSNTFLLTHLTPEVIDKTQELIEQAFFLKE